MEGTVTISVEDYEILKGYEKASKGMIKYTVYQYSWAGDTRPVSFEMLKPYEALEKMAELNDGLIKENKAHHDSVVENMQKHIDKRQALIDEFIAKDKSAKKKPWWKFW